jgi:hypothetical protein
LDLHSCPDCGGEYYTRVSAESCTCDLDTRKLDLNTKRIYECKTRDPYEHPLSELLSPQDQRPKAKIRLAIHPLITSGLPTISDCVRSVFNHDRDTNLSGTSDYQLAYRFYTQHDEYFNLVDQNHGTAVEPRLPLLDLITEGISQDSDEPLGDREFCQDLLSNIQTLSDSHKDHLEEAFQSYIDRVDLYRVFLKPRDGFGSVAGRSYLRTRYKTRFNDVGRVKQQFAKFRRSLEVAPLLCHDNEDVLEALDNFDSFDADLGDVTQLSEIADDLDRLDSDDLNELVQDLPERAPRGAVLMTVTTNPDNFDNLLESINEMNPDHNRLQQWLAYQPSTKPFDGRERWEGRLPYIKALEFTKDGKPHLHLLFFNVPRKDGRPYLVDKSALVEYCRDNLGRCRIVDLEPLEYRNDLGDRYEPDSGFVSPYETQTDIRDGIQEGQTAGQYLGKYLSATFSAVLDASETGSEYLETVDEDKYEDKTSKYLLALYWATDKSILTFSKDLEALALLDRGGFDLDAFEYVGTYHIDNAPASLLSDSIDFDFLQLSEVDMLPSETRSDRPPPTGGFSTRDRLLGKQEPTRN